MECFHFVLDTVFRQDATVRIKDRDGKRAAAIDTVQRIAYSMAVLGELAKKARKQTYRRMGIKEVMVTANADLKFLGDFLRTDMTTLLEKKGA